MREMRLGWLTKVPEPGSYTRDDEVVAVLMDWPLGPQIITVLASSVGVLIILMFFPGGLGAAVYKLRDAVLRRVAIRRRIYVPSLLGGFGMVGGQMSRAPLAPKTAVNTSANPTVARRRYRLPSRIGAAGASQQARRWTF